MTSTPIFEAMMRRDHGMADAENAADPRVILAIDAAIERAIASGKRFSANDIRDQFPTTRSKGLVGARVNSYANRKGVGMVKVGSEPSNLESTHGKEIAVWRGVMQAVAS